MRSLHLIIQVQTALAAELLAPLARPLKEAASLLVAALIGLLAGFLVLYGLELDDAELREGKCPHSGAAFNE